MRFPCKEHEDCENYTHDSCDGCGVLKKYPAWFIKAGEQVSKLMRVGSK